MIKIDVSSVDAYRPNDVIDGAVFWDKIPPDTSKIEVRLIWYTSGKGDRNHDIVDSKLIEKPEISGESAFQFIAPHRPLSFSGKLISLTWAIEAIVFPGLETEQFEVLISKLGREIILN